MLKRKPFWIITFLALFILSMDFWGWNDPIVLKMFNLPSWLWYFIALDLLLLAAIWAFTKYYWNYHDIK